MVYPCIIANAVAYRDYASNGSVQVMLFPDRLEVLNPGRLPVGLTIEELYSAHKSIPANPLLAESLYLHGTIERMGTGTGDIIDLCTQMGLKQPKFRQGSGFEVVLFRKHSEKHVTMQETMQDVPIKSIVDGTNVTDNVIENVSDKKRDVRQLELLELLFIDSATTVAKLAVELKVSERTILRDLESLRMKERIKRIGSDTSGYWQILN